MKESKEQKALKQFTDLLDEVCKRDDETLHYYVQCGSVDLLQELVDKSIPKKVINKSDSIFGECPNIKCGGGLNQIYHVNKCGYCGQKLDWSDSNE